MAQITGETHCPNCGKAGMFGCVDLKTPIEMARRTIIFYGKKIPHYELISISKSFQCKTCGIKFFCAMQE